MDKKLHELRQARAKAIDDLEGLLGNKEAFETKEREIAAIDEKIAQAERAQKLSASRARPSGQHDQLDPGFIAEGMVAAQEIYFERGVDGRNVRKVPGFDHYLARARAKLRSSGQPYTPEGKPGFNSLGEQLAAVARYFLGGKDNGSLDPRLVRAPTGAGEIDPSAGGFLVQTDFSTAVFMRAYEMGELLGRVEKMSLS